MAYCTQCGAPLSPGTRFCPKCGTKVPESSPLPSAGTGDGVIQAPDTPGMVTLSTWEVAPEKKVPEKKTMAKKTEAKKPEEKKPKKKGCLFWIVVFVLISLVLFYFAGRN